MVSYGKEVETDFTHIRIGLLFSEVDILEDIFKEQFYFCLFLVILNVSFLVIYTFVFSYFIVSV